MASMRENKHSYYWGGTNAPKGKAGTGRSTHSLALFCTEGKLKKQGNNQSGPALAQLQTEHHLIYCQLTAIRTGIPKVSFQKNQKKQGWKVVWQIILRNIDCSHQYLETWLIQTGLHMKRDKVINRGMEVETTLCCTLYDGPKIRTADLLGNQSEDEAKVHSNLVTRSHPISLFFFFFQQTECCSAMNTAFPVEFFF